MYSRSTSRESPHNGRCATETVEPQSDRQSVADRRERSQSRSTGSRRTFAQTAPMRPAPLAERARGHVIGRGLGEPLPALLAGRPLGHVRGRGIGEPTPTSLLDRPRGHVIGRGIGEATQQAFTGRPYGHVVEPGIVEPPATRATNRAAA